MVSLCFIGGILDDFQAVSHMVIPWSPPSLQSRQVHHHAAAASYVAYMDGIWLNTWWWTTHESCWWVSSPQLCLWTTCPHLSHWNHQGCNQLTIRGISHQVDDLFFFKNHKCRCKTRPYMWVAVQQWRVYWDHLMKFPTRWWYLPKSSMFFFSFFFSGCSWIFPSKSSIWDPPWRAGTPICSLVATKM